MEIQIILSLIKDFTLVLLAISPTVFVFSVTLLGTAIERAQQEEKAARENDKTNIQKEIDEIEISLKRAKQNGDTTELTSKLEQLKKKQIETEKKIKEIKIKYNSINLTNTVLCPCFAFVLLLVISPLGSFSENINILSLYLIIFSQLLLLSYGTVKIYRSLKLIQEINANKKESEYYTHLRDTFKLALQEYYQGVKEEVSVEFIDKAFPLSAATSTELIINFRVKLIKGSVLNNLSVWFFISDGFELILPLEDESWKQASDYDPPNIRTVRIKIGTLSVGPYTAGILKIKTPSNPGKYLLRYKVYADGYAGSAKDLTILVG